MHRCPWFLAQGSAQAQKLKFQQTFGNLNSLPRSLPSHFGLGLVWADPRTPSRTRRGRRWRSSCC
eukprot:13592936-Alexandrium_andersonii.AAC.1